jgi:RNA polymerase-binding protein DksA
MAATVVPGSLRAPQDPSPHRSCSGRSKISSAVEDHAMNLTTQNHLPALRDLLTYRLRELRLEVHAADQAQQESAAGTHEVADRKDEATQRQFSAVDNAQAQRDVAELAQVEAALLRLDHGTYGDCADCGEPIPLQRLLVQPAALRCAPCQAAHEIEPGRPGPGHASS